MTIDAHSHWRPQALIEALRERRQNPHIRKNISGVNFRAESVSGIFRSLKARCPSRSAI